MVAFRCHRGRHSLPESSLSSTCPLFSRENGAADKLSLDRIIERAKRKADSGEKEKYEYKRTFVAFGICPLPNDANAPSNMSAIFQKGQCDVITNDVPHSKRQ